MSASTQAASTRSNEARDEAPASDSWKREISECVERETSRAMQRFEDDVDVLVSSRFYAEMNALEHRWTGNPHMDAFRQATRDKDNAYADVVQQIAADFRRYFFEHWASELRRQRPFMNAARRASVEQNLTMRFGGVQSWATEQLQTLRDENKALHARVAELESLVREIVEYATIQPDDKVAASKDGDYDSPPLAGNNNNPGNERSEDNDGRSESEEWFEADPGRNAACSDDSEEASIRDPGVVADVRVSPCAIADDGGHAPLVVVTTPHDDASSSPPPPSDQPLPLTNDTRCCSLPHTLLYPPFAPSSLRASYSPNNDEGVGVCVVDGIGNSPLVTEECR